MYVHVEMQIPIQIEASSLYRVACLRLRFCAFEGNTNYFKIFVGNVGILV